MATWCRTQSDGCAAAACAGRCPPERIRCGAVAVCCSSAMTTLCRVHGRNALRLAFVATACDGVRRVVNLGRGHRPCQIAVLCIGCARGALMQRIGRACGASPRRDRSSFVMRFAFAALGAIPSLRVQILRRWLPSPRHCYRENAVD